MADELDVRQLRKPDKHPTIFAWYGALEVGGSFVLVNNHDPKHLRAEFDSDHPGSYRWEYLEKGPQVWRIRISKLASTPLPRVVVNSGDLWRDSALKDAGADATGAVWQLEVRKREPDAGPGTGG